MAVKLISIGTSMNTNAGVYKADNVSDMNSMSLDNVEFGSECLVIATGVRYILNSNGEWKKQPGIVIGSDLPEVDPSDEGKVLTVDDNGAWIAEDLPVELPTITSADEGKVLTVDDNGAWAAENLPEELPAVGVSDKNKFLHTNDSTGTIEWVAAPTELPSVSSVDNGKILTVVEGTWDKAALPTILEVHLSDQTLDKTWQEIHQATIATINYDSDLGQVREFVIRCWYDDVDQLYKISAVAPTMDFQSVQEIFEASTVNDYPVQDR